jgi:hypothetical protein
LFKRLSDLSAPAEDERSERSYAQRDRKGSIRSAGRRHKEPIKLEPDRLEPEWLGA